MKDLKKEFNRIAKIYNIDLAFISQFDDRSVGVSYPSLNKIIILEPDKLPIDHSISVFFHEVCHVLDLEMDYIIDFIQELILNKMKNILFIENLHFVQNCMPIGVLKN